MTRPPYDPLEILAALERNRVAFVLIGRLAAVIHGAGGIADDVEICVQVKEANLDRLRRALQQIDVTDGLDSISAIAEQADAATNVELHSPVGSIVLQARNSITTSGDFTGDALTLASGSSLTLQTENTLADGAGVINLTGSVEGSNLTIATSGAGAITINASTDGTSAGNITLPQLTAGGTGAITVTTGNGTITTNGTITGGSGGVSP